MEPDIEEKIKELIKDNKTNREFIHNIIEIFSKIIGDPKVPTMNLENITKSFQVLHDEIMKNRDAINDLIEYRNEKEKITPWNILSALRALAGS